MEALNAICERIAAHDLDVQLSSLKEGAAIVQRIVRAALTAIADEPNTNHKFLLSERIAEIGNVIMGEMLIAFRQPNIDTTTRNQIAMLIGHLRSNESLPYLETIVTEGLEVDVPLSAQVLLKCDHERGVSAILTRLNKEDNPAIIETLLGLLVEAKAYIPKPIMQRLHDGPQTWGISRLLAIIGSDNAQ